MPDDLVAALDAEERTGRRIARANQTRLTRWIRTAKALIRRRRAEYEQRHDVTIHVEPPVDVL